MSVLKTIINRFMGGRERKGEEESATPKRGKKESESDSDDSISSEEMKHNKKKPVDSDDSRSSTPSREVKPLKPKKTAPKPSNIPYESESSDDEQPRSPSQSLIRPRKRFATHLHFPSESGSPKKHRSDSSESSQSYASNTEEEIDIGSQFVTTKKIVNPQKKKKPVIYTSSESSNDAENAPLEIALSVSDKQTKENDEEESIRLDNFSPLTINGYYLLEEPCQNHKPDENTNDVAKLVVNEKDIDVEKHLRDEKIGRKKKKCISVCRLIDIVHHKNHPFRKFSQLFTHKSLKGLSKQDYAMLRSAAVALSRK